MSESEEKDKPEIEVISSAVEAAATIKKEKERKRKMLEDIFSNNTTGRYSGPTDA